jgi:hypothetical protein
MLVLSLVSILHHDLSLRLPSLELFFLFLRKQHRIFLENRIDRIEISVQISHIGHSSKKMPNSDE